MPTVGRIVWFYAWDYNYKTKCNYFLEPQAAIVVYVDGGGVNLTVFTSDGDTRPVKQVPFGERRGSDYATWPPRS